MVYCKRGRSRRIFRLDSPFIQSIKFNVAVTRCVDVITLAPLHDLMSNQVCFQKYRTRHSSVRFEPLTLRSEKATVGKLSFSVTVVKLPLALYTELYCRQGQYRLLYLRLISPPPIWYAAFHTPSMFKHLSTVPCQCFLVLILYCVQSL